MEASYAPPAPSLPFPQLVLLPRVSELPGFHGAEAAVRQEELERYQCLEVFHMAPPHPLAEACARLVCSVSALMHGGALREWGAAGWDRRVGRAAALLGQWFRICPCPWHGGQDSSGRAWAGVGRCRKGSPGPTLVLLPQPASATHRAPAAASARCKAGSVSASPTSLADAATTVPQAALALGPWDAAVSTGIFVCRELLSLHSVCPAISTLFPALFTCLCVPCVHLSPAVL